MAEDGIQLYECRICWETPKEAVVPRCGHLFCWPCLHQWFLTWPDRKRCPMCPALVDDDVLLSLGKNTENPESNEVLPDAE